MSDKENPLTTEERYTSATRQLAIVTRAEAKEKGLKRYFTGAACKHGHVSERATSNATCLDCDDIKKKEWQRQNRDAICEKRRMTRIENLEKVRELQRISYRRNREKANERTKKYYEKTKNLSWLRARNGVKTIKIE